MLRAAMRLVRGSAVLRFLVCGGTAAAINWLARIALSAVMPFEPAVLVAYAIGMTAGFILYRTLVWPGGTVGWRAQVPAFLAVNAAGAVVVLAAAVGLEAAGAALAGPSPIVEAVAHGLASGIGAGATYVGHSRITFAARG